MNDIKFRDILYDNRQIGPYPTDKLHHVDRPTVKILGEVKRSNPLDAAFERALRGELGPELERWAPLMTVTEPLGAAFVSVQKHINTIRKTPIAPKKAPIPDDPHVLARHIKSLAYFLGADMCGVCELPQSAVLTNDYEGNPIEAPYKYAIVIIVRKHLPTVAVSCGYDWIFDPVSFQAYQRLACQSETLTGYIRRLGHEAEASNMWNYLTVMPPLIMWAGLGEPSKMSLMVNPFLGANFKSAAVLTNLPLETDKPIDFGLQEYCLKCDICTTVCPSGALKGEKIIYNNYEFWGIDGAKCESFNILNKHGCVCGRCTKMCPWSREYCDPRDFEDWDGSTESLWADADKLAKQRTDARFKDPRELTDKWWFDLERKSPEDRELVIPLTTER